MVSLLIDKGADVNGTIDGKSYLAHCINAWNKEMFSLLLDKGADVNGTINGIPYLAHCIKDLNK